jgi:hypothetical protein
VLRAVLAACLGWLGLRTHAAGGGWWLCACLCAAAAAAHTLTHELSHAVVNVLVDGMGGAEVGVCVLRAVRPYARGGAVGTAAAAGFAGGAAAGLLLTDATRREILSAMRALPALVRVVVLDDVALLHRMGLGGMLRSVCVCVGVCVCMCVCVRVCVCVYARACAATVA